MSIKLSMKQIENKWIPYIHICNADGQPIIEARLDEILLNSLELNIENCPNVLMELCFYLENIKQQIIEKWR